MTEKRERQLCLDRRKWERVPDETRFTIPIATFGRDLTKDAACRNRFVARGDKILKPSLPSPSERANCRCTGWKWHGKRNRKGKIRGRMERRRGVSEEERGRKSREQGDRGAVWAWAEVFNGAVSMNCETCSRGIIYSLGSSTMFDAEDRSEWIGWWCCKTDAGRETVLQRRLEPVIRSTLLDIPYFCRNLESTRCSRVWLGLMLVGLAPCI